MPMPLLSLLAVAAAIVGQASLRTRPWLGLVGLVSGMVLFHLSERRAGNEVHEEPSPAPWVPPATWGILFGGIALCAAAAVAVFLGYTPKLTHGLWFGGLAMLALAAVMAQRRETGVTGAKWQAGDFAAMAVLLGVCAALLGWRLTAIPPEVHGDDAEIGLDAIRLLKNAPFNLFQAGWFDLPMFHAAPTAIGLRIFGINLLGLRMTSVVLGTLTILLVYAVARRLWGRRVAFLSAAFLVGSPFFIHLSRAGYHYIDTPFVAVLAIWLFLRVWNEHRTSAAIWCGVALGLGVQTYYATRLVPPLLAATWFFWLARERKQRTSRTRCFVVIVAVALATAAPMGGYFAQHPDDLWSRTQDTSIFTPRAREHLAYSYHTDDLADIFRIQMGKTLALFHARGDTSVQYGSTQPLLDPVSGVLFVLGLAAWCARPRDMRAQLVLLWLVVPVIAGAALTIDTPFYPRISGAMPFVAITVAYGLHRLLKAVPARLRGRGGAVTSIAAAAVLAVVFRANIQSYFVDYAPNHRHSVLVEIAAWVRQNGAGRTTYLVGGAPSVFMTHGTIQFLTHGYQTRDISNLEGYLRHYRPSPQRSAFVIMPDGLSLLPQLEAALGVMDVRKHTNARGAVFYTAVPLAGEPALPEPGTP